MTRFPPGAQSWVELVHPDAARGFYSALFGWEAAFGVARLGGRSVAGFGVNGGTRAWVTRVQAPEDVGERVRRAGGTFAAGLLRDASGAVLGVAARGAELVNEPGSWDLSTLRTPEPDRAIAFYRDVLGWQAEPFGRITLWRLPGYVGGLDGQPVPRDTVAIMEPQDGPPQWSVDFRVTSADRTAERAVALGGTVVEPAQDTPGFRGATLADPRGITFTITEFVGFAAS